MIQTYKKFITDRKFRQWFLAPIVLITIGLGWKYYWINFVVPLVMILNMLSPLLHKGRFVCGNFCPRGAFFDRLLKPISGKNRFPGFFTNRKFRWFIFMLIFGNFIIQVLKTPFTTEHLAHIFWLMCTITTILAIALGLVFNHRAWCAFCPVGTFISSFDKDVHPLAINNTCVSCRLCEKTCPLGIVITNDKKTGALTNRDCLKCQECVTVCPKKALQIR